MRRPAGKDDGSGRGAQPPPLGVDLPPMEAKLVEALPSGPGWQFEPKWDGFRCLAFRSGGEVALQAKSGKPLARYFPEIAEVLLGLEADRFVVDGELAIPVGESLSFDALQMRLHPAESRIRRLARETPARFILFDCLMAPGGGSLIAEPLSRRRAALERFVEDNPHPSLRISPATLDRAVAEEWLKRAGGALDGVVGKRADGAYEPGERAMVKVKRLRTADCVVGGFRYASRGRDVGSLLLGLYDADGLLHHVGFTSGFAELDRAALTKELESLREGPGFTGRAPGGPSRWSTERSGAWEPLRPELVVEVRYDHVTGDRFRHGTRLVRRRPDKAPRQCTFEQLEREARPSELVRAIAGA
ncbi:ATP-dependent DNA ligase [Faunimonas sp. B44]|uniref:ATP-dependent DNA ligase n=1 Tax=Faunimonas sp. B44 TaxID=3461493 RepID=UPI004043ED4E